MAENRYFVTFGVSGSHGYFLDCGEVSVNDYGLSPGMLAQDIQTTVSKKINNPSVVIINFWRL